MFGMGMGMDIGMDMGMGMGMDMGMGMGMDMGMAMGADMMAMDMMAMDTGMMMGGGMMGGGMMGPREQIIINNGGMGGGTTIIENGRGMGMGMGGMREEIIVNNGNTTIIENGRRRRGGNNVTVVGGNCPVGCNRPCCVQRGPQMYQQPQYQQPQYQQGQYQQQNQYQQNQQFKKPQYQQPPKQVVVEKPVYIEKEKPVYIEKEKPVYIEKQVIVEKPTIIEKQVIVEKETIRSEKPVKRINKMEDNQSLVSEQVYQGQIMYPEKKNQISPYGPEKNMQKQKQQPLAQKELFFLKFGHWEGPTNYTLTVDRFQNIPVMSISKIKVRRFYLPYTKELPADSMVLKVCSGTTENYFTSTMANIEEFFLKITWAKMSLSNRYSDLYGGIHNSQVSGLIFKKSEVLGKWEKRFVKIGYMGLQSFKNQNTGPSLSINQTGELWTRFEYINGASFIVVKLKHSGIKIEFGIPCQNAVEWLRFFYSLVKK